MRSDFLSRLISKPAPSTAPASRERPSRTAPDGWSSLMAAAQDGHGGAYRRLLGEMSWRSEEHTSELQSLMRISYDVFCMKKKITNTIMSYKSIMTRQNIRTHS